MSRRLYLPAIAFLLLVYSFQTAHAADRDTIVYAFPSNVGPLNPHQYSPNQMFAQEMVYEPLVRLGHDGTVEPCLAERWEISADGLEYTFHLRPGVRFSDGQPFDATAVVRNFEAVLANARRHAWLPLTEKIESFSAPEPLVFKLVLREPYYPTLDDLSLPRPFRFLSPAALQDDGTSHNGVKSPVGTGPWKLERTALGEYDLFSRNDLYWNMPPLVSQVLVRVIPDPLSRAVALQTGEVDLIYGVGQISYDTFDGLRRDPAFATDVSEPVGTMALALNTARHPTDDRAVRLALQHAVDKDALLRGVFLGTQPRADTLFSPTVPYCDVGLKPYAHGPARASALLEDAGWHLPPGGLVREKNGLPLRIDLVFVGNDAAQKAVAEVIQAQAARVGMFLNLVSEEEDAFYRSQREGTFGMIINTTWGPPFEPHAMVGSMRQPSHADYQAQRGLAAKQDLDEAITRVLATVDAGERRSQYQDILRLLHEEAVYIPVFHTALLLAYREQTLDGVHFGPGKSNIPFERFTKP